MVVLKIMYTILTGTVITAIESSIRFPSMTDDLAPAIRAPWGEHMDGTLKTIEGVCIAVHAYLEAVFVRVATYFACAFTPAALEQVCEQIRCNFHLCSLSCHRFFGQILDIGFFHPQVDRILTNPHHPPDRD